MKRIAAVAMLATILSPLLSPAVGVSLQAPAEPEHPPGCPWSDSAAPCPHGHGEDPAPPSGPRMVNCHDPGPSFLSAPDLRLAPPDDPLRGVSAPVAEHRATPAVVPGGIESPPPIAPPPRPDLRA